MEWVYSTLPDPHGGIYTEHHIAKSDSTSVLKSTESKLFI